VQQGCDLSRNIGWKKDKNEVVVRSWLAKIMWKSKIARRRKEAFSILSEILQVGPEVLGKSMFKDLHDTYDLWAKT
jgi:hypothetical protein